jgi:hypothetical protein
VLPHCKFISATVYLNSVLAFLGTLISSKSRVYLLTDRDQVGQSASRSVGFSKWTVLIGRSGFDTRPDNEFFELSVGVACDAYLLEIEGLLTQGSRPGRTPGGSVSEVSGMDNLIGCAGFDTKTSIPDPTLSLTQHMSKSPFDHPSRSAYYSVRRPPLLETQCRIWYRRYGIECRSTNSN